MHKPNQSILERDKTVRETFCNSLKLMNGLKKAPVPVSWFILKALGFHFVSPQTQVQSDVCKYFRFQTKERRDEMSSLTFIYFFLNVSCLSVCAISDTWMNTMQLKSIIQFTWSLLLLIFHTYYLCTTTTTTTTTHPCCLHSVIIFVSHAHSCIESLNTCTSSLLSIFSSSYFTFTYHCYIIFFINYHEINVI